DLQDQLGGFTLALLDTLFSKGLRTVKSLPPKCHLGFSRVLKVVLDGIKSILCGTSCGRDGLHAQYLIDCLSSAAVDI
ncbi:hypothetical protein Tco_0636593, partial [Tanacetum coccineum]